MGNLKKVVALCKKPNVIKFLLSTYYSGYLKDIGWFNSFEKKEPLDAFCKPIAWVTYPFIHFIEPRLSGVENIFEYGSGNSTLYYSSLVESVVSIEHDKRWFESIRKLMPNNVDIFYCELDQGGEYSRFSSRLEVKFDLIIVDGRDRVNCIKESVKNLSDVGVIVLDDSERSRYKEGVDFLSFNGFKKIDFWGVSPGLFYTKCTTIFYKENNVLGI